MRIIRAIVAGERDPDVFASLANLHRRAKSLGFARAPMPDEEAVSKIGHGGFNRSAQHL